MGEPRGGAGLIWVEAGFGEVVEHVAQARQFVAEEGGVEIVFGVGMLCHGISLPRYGVYQEGVRG